MIGGTSDAAGEPAVTGFGEFFVDQLRVGHVERWKDETGTLIQVRLYAPTTVNTWLAILRVAGLKQLFPQPYGMAFLGLATGLRLRRCVRYGARALSAICCSSKASSACGARTCAATK